MSIQDNTKGVLSEVDRLIKAKLSIAALMVERTAKQTCPVRTGTLKRSITHKVEKRSAAIGSNVEYAPFLELGTSKMSPRPFLRPALEANRNKIEQLFGAK